MSWFDKNIKDEYQTMTIDSLSIRSWRISAVHDYYDTPRFDLAISPGNYTQVESSLCSDIHYNTSVEYPDEFNKKLCYAFSIHYRDLGGHNGLLGSTDYIKMEGHQNHKGERKNFVIECYLNYGWSWGNSPFQGVDFHSAAATDNPYNLDFSKKAIGYDGVNPIFYLAMCDLKTPGPIFSVEGSLTEEKMK